MKFKIINENSNRYRKLKRALFGDYSDKIKTFAIISPENPLGWENATEQEFKDNYVRWANDPKVYNKEAVAKLKTTDLLHRIEKTGDTALRYGGFTYIPLKGKYDYAEKSYCILNLTLSDAKAIAENYGQQSFFFAKVSKEGAVIGYYEAKNVNCRSYRLVEVSDTVSDETDAKNFYSKFGFKFRINMKEFGDAVPEVKNAQAFEESFDEVHRSFSARARSRRDAYREYKD